MTILNRYCTFIILSLVFIACNGQRYKREINATSNARSDTSVEAKIALPENGFYCGFLDSKGNLWFGSRGNGVYKLENNSFINYTEKNGLCSNDISCISEDRKGNLWFGTTNGVCRFNGEKFVSLKIPQSDTSSVWLDKVYPIVNPNQVMSILEDLEGNLWFGTNGAGVYHYDGTTFTQYLSEIGKIYEDGLQHNIVLSIVEDLKGNIWFTSLSHGGVSVYDGKEFKQYKNELSDDFVRVAYCDKKGNILIGTHGNRNGGLDLFDGKKFKTFHKTDDGLSSNNVRWIFEDKRGEFWIGSGNSQLSIFDGEHFSVFEGNEGQKYDRIIFVLEDTENNIWFGNRNGLWKFDGNKVIEIK
ncbi:MAG: hypothetical protein H6574_21605 [Lewinellaceae bacterium]|nr:hypothetical protein [Lewinellaceae bacterium]